LSTKRLTIKQTKKCIYHSPSHCLIPLKTLIYLVFIHFLKIQKLKSKNWPLMWPRKFQHKKNRNLENY
jgi:hypothetical protein